MAFQDCINRITKAAGRDLTDEEVGIIVTRVNREVARLARKQGFAGLEGGLPEIAALPPGRRKYVKLFLKGLGLRNLDEIPTTIEQKPYDLGRGFLSSENREKLISLAPNIVLRDVP